VERKAKHLVLLLHWRTTEFGGTPNSVVAAFDAVNSFHPMKSVRHHCRIITKSVQNLRSAVDTQIKNKETLRSWSKARFMRTRIKKCICF
jgi:hypothetical protein